MRALAANDERIIEYFREKQKPNPTSEKSDLIQFEIDEIIGNEIATDELLNQIELQAWSRLAKLSWRPFEEAREFTRMLNLQSQTEWQQWCTHKKVRDIPTNPKAVYPNDWISLGDWLGTGIINNRQKSFLKFEEARKLVHKLNIKSNKDWRDYTKSSIYNNLIPKTPEKVYHKKWRSWTDWLGNEEKSLKYISRNFVSYAEFKKYINGLNIRKESEWRSFLRDSKVDNSIPRRPDTAYKNNGWIGWSDVFDRPVRRNKDFLEFSEFKFLLKSNNIRSKKEYRLFYQNCSNETKSRIPFDFESTYKNKGWKGWADFLGKEEKE